MIVDKSDSDESNSSGDDVTEEEPSKLGVLPDRQSDDQQKDLVASFISACERNTLEDFQFVSKLTCASAVQLQSPKAIGNLLRWVGTSPAGQEDPAAGFIFVQHLRGF